MSTRKHLAGLLSAVLLLTGCGSTVQMTSSTAGGADGTQLGSLTPGSATSSVLPGALPTEGSTGSVTSPESGQPGSVSPGSVGAGGGSTGSTGGGGTATGSIPTSGRGWTASTVLIGVVTNTDVQQVATTVGVNTLDSGDQKADAEAMIAHLNRTGGLYGRKVQGVFLDVKTSGGSESNAQAACTFFTQDHQVIAVVNGALQNDGPTFRACMTKAKVPVLAFGSQPLDEKVLAENKGYYNFMVFPSWERLAKLLASRLTAQGYFTGWNTDLGASGPAPVKVGIVTPDTEIGRRVGDVVSRELGKVGHAPSDTFRYVNIGEMQNAVLQFRANGVTHVVSTDQFIFLFLNHADSQNYRPRYALTTPNLPTLLLQGASPARQLVGSMGIGHAPTFDVDSAHDPGGIVRGAADCRGILAKSGLTYPSDKRFAFAYAYLHCDAFKLLQTAARVGQGLSADSIVGGLGLSGEAVPAAYTFSAGLTSQHRTWPASAQDLYWDTACPCMRYRGPLRRY